MAFSTLATAYSVYSWLATAYKTTATVYSISNNVYSTPVTDYPKPVTAQTSPNIPHHALQILSSETGNLILVAAETFTYLSLSALLPCLHLSGMETSRSEQT